MSELTWDDEIHPRKKEFLSRNYNWIPFGCCRECEKPIEPYEEVFEMHEREAPEMYWILSQSTRWCRKCAMERIKKNSSKQPLVLEIDKTVRADGHETILLSNGWTEETLTAEEKERIWGRSK